ncbi:hypothetical protein N802_12180 [Knoellia sinensis KCTC 19936]|uniref:Uncharacterized protein n=1 Tax=Knoellia sinensis KCTC 19936 TaxID=1385520 RepID=A0A0A0JE92_9MICO|nr:hypothetical protein [Knoellia sinensis]KGN34382.1 hypothetical protein N802_12180 [Knoellia sinensis KCTC 19936]
MEGMPNPDWDKVSGWFDGSDPRTTRAISWGAIALLAIAFALTLGSSGGEQHSPNVQSSPSVAAGSSPSVGLIEPACTRAPSPRVPRRPDPRPPGLAKFSTGPVGPGAVVESTRWGQEGRDGLWGVAAVAGCDAARLDAVWVDSRGQKHRHQISDPGQSVIGVVANGLDGAISVYAVRAQAEGPLSAMLHISTDWGATWQERVVPTSAEPHVRAGVLSPDWRQWRILTR